MNLNLIFRTIFLNLLAVINSLNTFQRGRMQLAEVMFKDYQEYPSHYFLVRSDSKPRKQPVQISERSFAVVGAQ